MPSPNTNYGDALTLAIESRTKALADNMSDNNALLYVMRRRGNVKPFSGGVKILQELDYADNVTSKWYSGYDTLDTSASELFTAAEFPIAQAAVSVVMSGLETLQNAGEEKFIDLADARMTNAERTLMNLIGTGLYSDGTGDGGKQMAGLQAAVPDNPTTGTYGNINRATAANAFWRSKRFRGVTDGGAAVSAANIRSYLNQLMFQQTRGTDKPDLITMDNNYYGFLMESLQAQQRFSEDAELAKAGFTTLKFGGADVILDGGQGGNCPANRAYVLNTRYIHFRPHRDRNFTMLDPKRFATNQDAEVRIIAFAGNLTLSNAFLQGNLQA
jgi:hypothetical protein